MGNATNVPGWNSTIFIFNGVAGPHWPTPFEGNQYADIGNAVGPVFTQSFTVIDPGMYSVSWAANTGYYGVAGPSPYSMSLSDSSGQIFAHTYDAFNDGVWKSVAESMALASGLYSLSFAPQGVANGFDALLDAVSVLRTGAVIILPPTAVPDETSTGLALVIVFGALTFGRNRIGRLVGNRA